MSGPTLARRSGPLLALLVYGGIYVLWRSGRIASYEWVLGAWGIQPYRIPFLDLDAILAARRCAAMGVDVFVANPCDVFGRVHVYSPLWLLGAAPGPAFPGLQVDGCLLDLLFLLSLWLLPQPARWNGFAATLAATLSTMVVYALERANNDLVIFIMIVVSARIVASGGRWHLAGYAGFLAAGLLKFYPLMLGAIAWRERRVVAIGVILAGAAATAAMLVLYHRDFAELVPRLPSGSPNADLFGASNVPRGIDAMLGPTAPRAIGMVSLAFLLALAGLNARRMASAFDTSGLAEPTRLLLTCGLLLLLGCFFAGQSVGYRGVFFLLVLPGLAELDDDTPGPTRTICRGVILAILVLMWEEPCRLAVTAWAKGLPEILETRVIALFWIGRELLWWWLMAAFGGLLWAVMRSSGAPQGRPR
jgi:hypothetical protein